MSYIRIYPEKNNTIFKRNAGTVLQTAGNINTGQNPIMEMHDGNSQSRLIMNFNLDSIKAKLLANTYTCNLKMFDAGVIFEPTLKDLKTIDLYYFTEDFIEGDGFAFLDGKAIEGVSNWNKRDDVNTWGTIWTAASIPNAFQLNSAGDDIVIENLQTYVTTALTANKNPNFAVALHSNTTDVETYTKFLYGRRTRTIFKPYLEFYIDDEILDTRRDTYATKQTSLFLVNQAGEDFTELPVCRITDSEGSVIDTPTVNNLGNGIYRVQYTPDITYSNAILKDIWSIGAEDVYSGMITVKSPNIIIKKNLDDLYFYVASSYTHPLIRLGDIVGFNLVAEDRKRGACTEPNFEYKIFASNNYDMVPWMPVSVYRDKLFFYVDTSFFFPELEYEIIVRYRDNNITRSSLLTYKFRVVTDGPTHLAGRAANPYNDRNYMQP